MLLPANTGSGVSVLVTARLAWASVVQRLFDWTVVKLLPEIEATLHTWVVPGGSTGVLMVAENITVTLSPAGSSPILLVTVSPENGAGLTAPNAFAPPA